MAALMAAAVEAPAGVAPVTVVNPGFETLLNNGNPAVLSDGQFTIFKPAGTGNSGLSGPLSYPGWTVFSNTGDNGGLLNPAAANIAGGAVPEGHHAAFLRSNFGISQTLTQTLQAHEVYGLSVSIGDRSDTSFAGFLVELRAGGMLLASIDHASLISQSVAMPSNGFLVFTLSFDPDPQLVALMQAGLIGQALEIRLSASAVGTSFQTLFDGVTMTRTFEDPVPPPAIPAPSPGAALLLCAAVMLKRRGLTPRR